MKRGEDDSVFQTPAGLIFLAGAIVATMTAFATTDDYSRGWFGFTLAGLLMLLGVAGMAVDEFRSR